MVSKPVYIKDIIKQVVTDFTPSVLPVIKSNEIAALGTTMIDTINFQSGHLLELIQTLSQLDQSPQYKILKYPLVWLVQDFKEMRGRAAGFYASTRLNIIIAHQSLDTYKVTDRDEKVFKPVLYPIYYALMEGLATSDMINEGSSDLIEHDKTDRAYWGRQAISGTSANRLNDYVDAIELNNLDVTILYNNC